MALTRLQDDLLQEFNEERKMIYAQLELFDPLSDSLRKPAAKRLLHKGALILLEILLYLLSLGDIGVAVFFDRLYPFYILSQLRVKGEKAGFNHFEVEALYWTVVGCVAISAVLLYCLARGTRRIRLKNDVLQVTGKHIKSMIGQYLTRKAAIDAIYQRHFTESLSDYGAPPSSQSPVNSVPNPGYDEKTI
jgi:hypothetical protein